MTKYYDAQENSTTIKDPDKSTTASECDGEIFSGPADLTRCRVTLFR
ncbi:MAG: hypothetical protein AB9919_03240 [Geobacteraceae bacterium]